MSFARHQTFYFAIWLVSKGRGRAIQGSFSIRKKRRRGYPRYRKRIWFNPCDFGSAAAGLVDPKSSRNDTRLSPFGEMVRQFDPYFELDLTWWLIHAEIVRNKDEASSWYFLLNEYPRAEFDRAPL